MSTQSNQIDDALSAAQQELLDAANAGPYSADLQEKLDNATLLLQTMENSMLLSTQQAILDALANNNEQLKKLNADIDTFTAGVEKIAGTIKKVSSAIGTVVTVIGAVVSAGVI